MNPVRYFNNEWWELVTVDHARKALLVREQKEVYHEMIYQEYKEGKKSAQQVADEYGVHKSTVCRIARRKVQQLYPNQKARSKP